jgi:hypothetical protein
MEACRALTASTIAEELALLDDLWRGAWRDVVTDRIRMHRGQPVLTDPDDPGSTVPDWRRKLRAVDVCLRISDRRCKLLGLYPSHPGPRIGSR